MIKQGTILAVIFMGLAGAMDNSPVSIDMMVLKKGLEELGEPYRECTVL